MSFAFNAAPFNNNNNQEKSNNSVIENRRKAKNKTVKRRQSLSQINKLKEQLSGMDEDDNDLADFRPLAPPESVGAMKSTREDPIEDVPVQPVSSSMFSNGDAPVGQEAFQNLPSLAAEDYYKQFVPYYDRTNTGTISNNELTEKLDYMIHLLEEQKDFRTNHVTEEVILYSFLGVFIIFVLDSFARAGKYVR